MTEITSATVTKTPSRPLRPADLPIHVPLIGGETTLSFLQRTAALRYSPTAWAGRGALRYRTLASARMRWTIPAGREG
ncbi:hypothetical protein ACFYNO_32735 [Kitasatospora sp. NPDC006697]|uniref:hypothetical protein n=1 Tax=Kitasatospora sp. NPDC006697 TaxID=3364020 RepID=UPI0036BA53FA